MIVLPSESDAPRKRRLFAAQHAAERAPRDPGGRQRAQPQQHERVAAPAARVHRRGAGAPLHPRRRKAGPVAVVGQRADP
ncbi:hypothetical protein CBM2604_A140068 [Cupriavidus taiwanensis]|nr:hypothetical protein CBM2604_A140068 [Cupriavidus taiwanensis]